MATLVTQEVEFRVTLGFLDIVATLDLVDTQVIQVQTPEHQDILVFLE